MGRGYFLGVLGVFVDVVSYVFGRNHREKYNCRRMVVKINPHIL